MANPLVKEQFTAKLSKRPFPLNCSLDFSSAPGMILPVYYCHLNAGEDFQGQVEMVSRTEDIETQSFTCIHNFVDWFFVPYQQIYREFGSFITGVDDVQSSLYADTDSFFQSHGLFPTMNDQDPFFINARQFEPGQFETFVNDLGMNDFQRIAEISPDLVDKFGYPVVFGTLRLYELLGNRLNKSPMTGPGITPYPSALYASTDDQVIQLTNSSSGRQNVALWAAYQKIWYDWFRDTDYDLNDRFAYNLDDFGKNGFIDFSHRKQDHAGLFQLRYRRWNTMYQNNFLPSPLQSHVGMLFDSNNDQPDRVLTQVNQWLSDVLPSLADSHGDTHLGSSPTNVVDIGDYVDSTANIDTIFAIRKISEVTRRAGKHYDDQILAHFGVKLPRDVNGEVYHIGESHSVIALQQVVSSADTDTAGLGQIGGKGHGAATSQTIKFRAPVPGIIMAVNSALPEVIMPYGKDKFIKRHYREDWYQPEFDRLGMQPLFESEVSQRANESNVLAWQYRYLEDKMKYNRSAGDLGLGASRSYWAMNVNPVEYDSSISPLNVNMLRYVHPAVLDPIMKIQYRPAVTQVHDSSSTDWYFSLEKLCNTDPLIHHFDFKCRKMSFMSTYGLPTL